MNECIQGFDLSGHAVQTSIEPSKDTFWLSIPVFAGNISSCTQHSRRAARLDPSRVMQSCAARLNARLTKQSVNCELLCIITARVRCAFLTFPRLSSI